MTDRKNPETLEDAALDDAQGGLVINLSVGVKAEYATRGVWKAPAGTEANLKDRNGGAGFGTTSGGDPNV